MLCHFVNTGNSDYCIARTLRHLVETPSGENTQKPKKSPESGEKLSKVCFESTLSDDQSKQAGTQANMVQLCTVAKHMNFMSTD